ncbi:hypothetical protein CALCODRAFT_295842 [Calocera cornea HHB12733]|uniref:Uncharacterized protein n=1 Tax=Calocera cornea HHB12733 TaxID=1353952 RepID=A0A165FPH2_9BASI|nr:hypothetical protein CALCODRAFT_295842 [Calocera cornea HHB12733]
MHCGEESQKKRDGVEDKMGRGRGGGDAVFMGARRGGGQVYAAERGRSLMYLTHLGEGPLVRLFPTGTGMAKDAGSTEKHGGRGAGGQGRGRGRNSSRRRAPFRRGRERGRSKAHEGRSAAESEYGLCLARVGPSLPVLERDGRPGGPSICAEGGKLRYCHHHNTPTTATRLLGSRRADGDGSDGDMIAHPSPHTPISIIGAAILWEEGARRRPKRGEAARRSVHPAASCPD